MDTARLAATFLRSCPPCLTAAARRALRFSRKLHPTRYPQYWMEFLSPTAVGRTPTVPVIEALVLLMAWMNPCLSGCMTKSASDRQRREVTHVILDHAVSMVPSL